MGVGVGVGVDVCVYFELNRPLGIENIGQVGVWGGVGVSVWGEGVGVCVGGGRACVCVCVCACNMYFSKPLRLLVNITLML